MTGTQKRSNKNEGNAIFFQLPDRREKVDKRDCRQINRSWKCRLCFDGKNKSMRIGRGASL